MGSMGAQLTQSPLPPLPPLPPAGSMFEEPKGEGGVTGNYHDVTNAYRWPWALGAGDARVGDSISDKLDPWACRPRQTIGAQRVRESGEGPTPSSLGKRWLHDAHQDGLSGGSWESFQLNNNCETSEKPRQSPTGTFLSQLDKMACVEGTCLGDLPLEA